MTITFDIEDTVTIHRPPVGEDTRVLGVYANHNVPRRPAGSGKEYVSRTAFAFVGSTNELPIIGIPEPKPVEVEEYTGVHRAKLPAEVVKPPVAPVTPAESVPPFRPSLMRRLFARLGRVGG